MSKFADVIATDPPRLVVTYQKDAAGTGNFSWGVVGQMPVLTLIGYITRVQAELAFRSPEPCDQSALVVMWDAAGKKMSYYVHPDIPADDLVGMLETIKTVLVDTQLAHVASRERSPIVGPDGNNFRRTQ